MQVKFQTVSRNAYQHYSRIKDTTNKAKGNLGEYFSPQITIGKDSVSFKGEPIDVETMKKNKAELIKQRDAAQAKLDRAKRWNYSKQKTLAEQKAETEIKREGLGFFNLVKKSRIRDKWMNEFYEKDREIDVINSKKAEYQSIVNTCNTALSNTSGSIDLGIQLNNINNAQDALNGMLTARGGLNQRIAGYGFEKSKIERLFVEPLSKSQNNPDIKVPSAILLHGATGTGKTTILDAIAEQSKGNVRIDDLTEEKDSNALTQDFKNKLKTARKKYLEEDSITKQPKRTRTILLINEAEKILAMTPEYAKEHLDYNLSESDYALLKTYDESTQLVENVNFFKGFLDHCSQAPKDSNDVERGALTVFITTNYPHLIHPDLLTRDGKLPYIAINPAEGSNIEAVVKHYTKLNSLALEAAKSIENIQDVDQLAGLTQAAKNKLKEYKKENKLDKLNIDYGAIPYDKVALMNRPTKELGAYSNDRYRKVSEEAFINYLEEPETPYYTHFMKVIIREKRDIGPKRYNKFYEIHRILAPLEVGEREELIKLEKTEALDEKYKARLVYIRMLEKADKENLLAKQQLGQISNEEKDRLNQILEYERLDNLSLEEYLGNSNKDED